MKFRSRDAICIRVVVHESKASRARTKKVREAKRRKARTTCRTNGCGASSAEDARLPALHRGACPGGLPPETQSRPRFTRRSAKALPSPGSPRLSEAPRVSVVVPRGSMPGPPGGESDEPPPAGTAPAPSVASPVDVPHNERDGRLYSNRGGDVKAFLFVQTNREVARSASETRAAILSRRFA